MAVQAQFPVVDSGGNGHDQFCFGHQWKFQPQAQQQQLQQHFQLPENQSFCFENNGGSVIYCQTMAPQVEEQRHEIDQFIKSQNESLRLLLQQQRKQQVAAMAKKLESKASLFLVQKETELAKAANKTMELQNLVNKLEMENQEWRRVAQENEAMVVSLNNMLEQLQQQQQQQQQNIAGFCFNNGVDDAESCCEEKNRGSVGTKTTMFTIVTTVPSKNITGNAAPGKRDDDTSAGKTITTFMEHDYDSLGGGANSVASGYNRGTALGAEIIGT
ncbi:hypothetical protein V6N13_134350 [Hibiscus sabdariffa]